MYAKNSHKQMKRKNLIKIVSVACITLLLCGIHSCSPDHSGSGVQLYDQGTGLESRSISFENPTGERGQGGQKSSNLGVGRKGFPAKGIIPEETVILCDIAGAGTIRHIWMTGGFKDKATAL